MDPDDAPQWARPSPDGWLLQIRAQPGAGRTRVVGVLGDELKVQVAAPANEGKANAELLRFLARSIGVPRAAVVLRSGERNRSKRVLVPGDADVVRLSPGGP